jgi:hypothetical protein
MRLKKQNIFFVPLFGKREYILQANKLTEKNDSTFLKLTKGPILCQKKKN